jgi:hypothetical protein
MKAGLGDRLSIIDPSRRGVEIASQVVKTMSTYSIDPHVLYAAKKQIIDELLDLDRVPRLIIQTNPLEHEMVENDCAIELYGWAEPGTRVVVNGRALAVAEDGLFMESMGLSRDHTIVVEAEHQKGKKAVVRSFEISY